MSIKNIVTGQLASVTAYDPTTAQVTGLSLGTGNLQLAGNLISTTSSVITIDPLDDGTGAGNVVVLGNMSVTGTLSYNNLSNTTTSNLTWIAASDAVSNSAATGGGLQVGLDNGVYATWLYNQPSNVWSASLGVSAPYFVGDGGNLSNITVAAGTYIANGTSSVAVAAVDGNIVFGVNGASYGQLGTANTVMIGYESGAAGTAEGAVALGKFAGYTVGNANVTAVGTLAGSLNARANSVSIGVGAGWGNMISGGGTGLNSIAIGSFAARNGSANNTIILNATGANFDGVASQANSFYVNPVRNDTGNVTNAVYYNTSTKEITYGPTASAFSGIQAPFSGALTAANMGQWIQANGNITLPNYTTVPTGAVITITNSATGGTTAAKVTVFNQTNDFIYYPPVYTSTNRSIQLFFGQWMQLMSRGSGEWDVVATNIGNAQRTFASVAQNAEFSMDLMNFRYTGSRLQFSPVTGSFTVYGQTLTLEPGSGPRSDSFNSATYTAGTWTDLTGVNITIAGSTAEAFLTALNGTYVRQYRVTCMVDSTNLAYITIERLYNTTL